MYVDAVYSYQPSSVVCLSVCLSVCHTSEALPKTRWTNWDAIWVKDLGGPREPCIRWGKDLPQWGAIMRGKGASHCKLYRHSAITCVKTAELIEMPFVLSARTGSRTHELDGVQIPCWKGQFREKGRPLWSVDFLQWAVQKQLNRLICCLGCGLGLEEQVQSYLPGGTTVSTWESTLAPPGKYHSTIHLQQQCSLMSNKCKKNCHFYNNV